MIRENIAVFALTICLFGCPFIFYYIDQKNNYQGTYSDKPIKMYEGITVHVHGELENKVYKVAVGTKIYELISDLNLILNQAWII